MSSISSILGPMSFGRFVCDVRAEWRRGGSSARELWSAGRSARRAAVRSFACHYHAGALFSLKRAHRPRTARSKSRPVPLAPTRSRCPRSRANTTPVRGRGCVAPTHPRGAGGSVVAARTQPAASCLPRDSRARRRPWRSITTRKCPRRRWPRQPRARLRARSRAPCGGSRGRFVAASFARTRGYRRDRFACGA